MKTSYQGKQDLAVLCEQKISLIGLHSFYKLSDCDHQWYSVVLYADSEDW